MKIQSAIHVETVGSFLLPEKLVEAQKQFDAGSIDPEQLRAAEDAAIENLTEHQLKAGLDEVTSGEFRRRQWDKDFWFGLGGICRERIESGHIYQTHDSFTDLMRFDGTIEYNPLHPFFYDFSFLHSATGDRARCRQTIPSPANIYLEILVMTEGHPENIYPNPDRLLSDIAQAYNSTIRHFHTLGCRCLQLDDTACGKLCENAYAKRLLQGGTDIIALHEQIISLINETVADIPSDMEISLYLSGGDRIIPKWAPLPLPDNIMPKVLSRVNVEKFFMPFNLDDKYQPEVLRHIPQGKKVVLGVIDAHCPFPESESGILRTLETASDFIPYENLSVSPRTGFKLTSYASRGLTYEDQWNKIAYLRAITER